jgi:enolase
VRLEDGTEAAGDAPSGASTGTHEALELRDGDARRYSGLGVQRAVRHIEHEFAPALLGFDVLDQPGIDLRLREVDGTPNKQRLGANASLAVSCAVAASAAASRRIPLWQQLAEATNSRPRLPVPMVNILSGGLHAGRNFEFQDFLALPQGLESYSQALEAVVKIHQQAGILLKERGCLLTGVADEGGWGPLLHSNEDALAVLTLAIERAGYRPGGEVAIAIDVAATHFLRSDGRYELSSEDRTLSAEEMVGMLQYWCDKYPVVSIEDGLAEDDWLGWQRLTRRLGGRVQVIGDDFFTTNRDRVHRGIEERAANSVLVKINQIGTVTEALDVASLCLGAGWNAVVSARSGETESSFLADLAVASGGGQIKVGSITRSERLAKYNRLLEIEASGSDLPYAARDLRFGLP